MTNDHTTAIVPLQSWTYDSPALRRDGVPIDVGLLAEALIYYDRVLLIPLTAVPVAKVIDQPSHGAEPVPFDRQWRKSFLELVEWFAQRGGYKQFVELFAEGTLSIYHYAFYTTPVLLRGQYSCWNIQDLEEQQRRETFMPRFLPTEDFGRIEPRARHREKLYRALVGRITEVHAEEFGPAVENARVDFGSARAATYALKTLTDELASLLPAGFPRIIEASAVPGEGATTSLTFNVDFARIARAFAPLEFGVPTPLCGLAHANRLLWSAATANCDLYLPAPSSRLVSAKLVESNDRRTRHHEVIETLEAQVDFPDIRGLVNSGAIGFDDVLRLRRHGQRFRTWLQTQAERDRDALIAYHHEVAIASGLAQGRRKVLRLFGTLASAGLGAVAGAALAGPVGAGVGAVGGKAVEEGVGFVLDLAGRLDHDWKPVVFGDWMRSEVAKANRTT